MARSAQFDAAGFRGVPVFDRDATGRDAAAEHTFGGTRHSAARFTRADDEDMFVAIQISAATQGGFHHGRRVRCGKG